MKDYLLVESSSLRKEMCKEENLHVLEKVGQLVSLSNDGWTTTEQAAKFFEVPVENVRQIIKSYREEFISDGYKVLSSKDFREVFKIPLKSKARSVAIFPRRAVLRMAMLLRDSKIAKNIRTYLLNQEQKQHSLINNARDLLGLLDQLTEHASQLAFQSQRISGNSDNLDKHSTLISQNADQLVAQSRIIKATVYELYENKNRIKKLEEEVGLLKAQKNSFEVISEEQIIVLREIVKKIGNTHKVWKGFRRKFGLQKYSQLPSFQFEEAICWLENYKG